MKSSTSACLAVLLLLTLTASPSSGAVVTIMDQIGTTGSFFTGDDGAASENFSDQATFDISTVDDFTVTGSTTITVAQAALLGFGPFTSFSLLTGYDVNVYSSLARANSSLTGDVYHATIPKASATVTTPFSGDAESGLVSLPVSIPLTAGTYYLSILADGTYSTDGEVGVYVSTGLAGSKPGGANAIQDNPAGGFGLAGNTMAAGGDAAYRLTGVPEPGTWTLLLGGLALLGGLRFYRHCMA